MYRVYVCVCLCLFVNLVVFCSSPAVGTNRLLLNDGHPGAKPTVVLGISGKPEKMCNLELVKRDEVKFPDTLQRRYFSLRKQTRPRDRLASGLQYSAEFAKDTIDRWTTRFGNDNGHACGLRFFCV